MRRSAKVRVVGKIEAIENPMPKVATQIAIVESFHSNATAALARHPARSVSRITRGLKREEIGIASSRPVISDPQNAEVKYAADALSILSAIA
jgi:hypothetical protein